MHDVDARHRDLLFLLGLGPLALGCSVGVPDDGPQFTSAAPGTPPGDTGATDEDTSGGTGAGDGASGQGTIGNPDDGVSVSVSVSVGDDGTTSGASASMSASVSVSVSMGDDMTSYDYTSGGLPPGGATCEAYGYLIASCYYGGDPMMAASLTANCEGLVAYYQMYYGPACAMAFEDAVACLSQLSCQQLPMYGNGLCDAEQAAFTGACV